MELHYHYWNQAPAGAHTPKMVLLHGMGGTGALWRPIAATLENELSLLAPDQRGHGKSRDTAQNQGPENYTPEAYGKDVLETLEAANFHPTWIVGHSMGVRTAVATAHLRPEWVKGLILVDLGFSGAAGGGLGEELARFLRLLPALFDSRDQARAFMKENCPDPSIAQYLMAVSTRDSEGRIHFPFDHSALIQTIEAARNFSIREWLRELGMKKMPILILRGEKSRVWSHEEFEREKEQFSDLESLVFLEVLDAGHGLPFEQRAVFNDLVMGFVKTGKITD